MSRFNFKLRLSRLRAPETRDSPASILTCRGIVSSTKARPYGTGLSEAASLSEFLERLKLHVTEEGKPLLSMLQYVVIKEKDLEREKLEVEREKDREIFKIKTEMLKIDPEKQILVSQVGNLTAQLNYLKELNGALTSRLDDLKELRTVEQLHVLRVKGVNNTRGLYEKIQEQLRGNCNKKGAALWIGILKKHTSLALCIEKHANVSARDVERQALNVYLIYTLLSQHVHAGKELADLQAQAGGTILFHRGPMSSEQVQIFKCLGKEAGLCIAEDPTSIPR